MAADDDPVLGVEPEDAQLAEAELEDVGTELLARLRVSRRPHLGDSFEQLEHSELVPPQVPFDPAEELEQRTVTACGADGNDPPLSLANGAQSHFNLEVKSAACQQGPPRAPGDASDIQTENWRESLRRAR